MDGGAEEVRKIQKIIEDQIFKKLSLPVSWLIFSLCLRKKALRMVSLQSCLHLAQQLNIPPDEAKLAIWFLHHYAGLLMHFPNLTGLHDSVICDTQIVYDSVTHLIVNTYKFPNVSTRASERFRDAGQFSLQDIREAVGDACTQKDHIPLNKLVQLLEYLNIIAMIRQPSSDSSSTACAAQSKEVYFMPCVLQNAPSAELKISEKSIPNPVPSPLMLRFTCGFAPTGIFTAMIANLVGQQPESLELIVDGIKKNRVQFLFGNDYDVVTIISKPRHYEIHISRATPPFEKPIHEVCTAVRDLIQQTLKTITSRFNYTFSLSYQFAFGCPRPRHGGGDHLCVVKSGVTSPRKMVCLQDMKKKVPVEMKNPHLVWFGETLPEALSGAAHDHCADQESSSANDVLTTADGDLDIDDLTDVLEALSAKWRLLCTKLGISESSLSTIEANHPRSVEHCLYDALREWLKLNYDYQRHGRPSWRRLAEVVRKMDYVLFEAIVKEHGAAR